MTKLCEEGPPMVREAGLANGRARASRGLLCGVVAVAVAAGCSGPPADVADARVLADGHASNPTTAVDAETGVGYVAWIETEAGESNVRLARLDAEGHPDDARRVNDIPGDAAPHLQAPPRVATGPGGQVYVVWQNNTVVEGRRFPASDLRFARSVDGGRTFEPAITVNDDADGPPTSHTFHDMVVAEDGTVVVSWLDGRDTGGGSTEAVAASARLEGGDAGAGGHAAHGSRVGPYEGPDVRVAVSRDGGRSFGPSVIVAEDTCPCCRTEMAVAPDGTLYAAWRTVIETSEGQVRDIVVARSPDGGSTWGEASRVHEDGWLFEGCPHAGPALTVDADGRLHVAWYTGREGAPGLFHASSRDGGRTFTDPSPLVAEGWVPPSQAELAVGPDDRLWTTWEDRTEPGRHRSLLTVADATSAPRARDATEIPGTHPSLASAGDHPALIAWLDGERVLGLRAR